MPESPEITLNSDGSRPPNELVDEIYQILSKMGFL